jgi:hypothetical protein
MTLKHYRPFCSIAVRELHQILLAHSVKKTRCTRRFLRGSAAATGIAVLIVSGIPGKATAQASRPNVEVSDTEAFEKGNEAIARRDFAGALNWYGKAAAQGNSKAQMQLGRMHLEGLGVPESLTEAFGWFRKAADQGDATAQMAVGAAYARGAGVGQDIEKAKLWLEKAAAQGNAKAEEILQQLQKSADNSSGNRALGDVQAQKIELICENDKYTAQVSVDAKTKNVVIQATGGSAEDWVDGRVDKSASNYKEYVEITDREIKFGRSRFIKTGLDLAWTDYSIDRVSKHLVRNNAGGRFQMECRPGSLKRAF